MVIRDPTLRLKVISEKQFYAAMKYIVGLVHLKLEQVSSVISPHIRATSRVRMLCLSSDTYCILILIHYYFYFIATSKT